MVRSTEALRGRAVLVRRGRRPDDSRGPRAHANTATLTSSSGKMTWASGHLQNEAGASRKTSPRWVYLLRLRGAPAGLTGSGAFYKLKLCAAGWAGRTSNNGLERRPAEKQPQAFCSPSTKTHRAFSTVFSHQRMDHIRREVLSPFAERILHFCK